MGNGTESSCVGALRHFKPASLRSATLHKTLRKYFFKMLCALALKDLMTTSAPDRLASESHSPCERELQQQLLPQGRSGRGQRKKLSIGLK